jgi:RNA polymerase sigma factor (sigma-70 family)
VIDHARRRQRHALPVAEPPEVAAVDPDGVVDAELWAAVRTLPPKQRTAVVQRYLFDRPYAEVAELVGCSEEAARQNVRAGIARLRERIPQEVTS